MNLNEAEIAFLDSIRHQIKIMADLSRADV
jgi:hypothetical protein